MPETRTPQVDTYPINLAEVNDPKDPKFVAWKQEKFQKFVSQDGSKQNDYKAIDANDINVYRFLKGLLTYLETNNGDWALIANTIEALASSKQKIIDQAALPKGNDLDAIQQIVGTQVDDVLDKDNFDYSLASRFDAHGIAKGGLHDLTALLDKGIDSNRPFHTSNFIKDGAYMGGGIHGPYTHGGFIIVSGADKMLRENGISLVVINWQYKEAATILARRYPHITFATPEGMEAALKHLAK